MIRIRAAGFGQFLGLFGMLHAAGVDVQAAGANEMTVPDDTDPQLLRAAADAGAALPAGVVLPVNPGEQIGDGEDGGPADLAPAPAAGPEGEDDAPAGPEPDAGPGAVTTADSREPESETPGAAATDGAVLPGLEPQPSDGATQPPAARKTGRPRKATTARKSTTSTTRTEE